MSDSTEELAARLRLAREQAGLSQGQVAKLLGVHRPTISEIEAGRRRVQAAELSRFADLYRVSAAWLLERGDGEDSPREAKVRLAARELSKLKTEDLDRVMNLLASLRRHAPAGGAKR